MTPKELMYLDDAIGMEEQLQTKCNDYASKVQDQTLRDLLQSLATKHQEHYTALTGELNQA